MSSKGIGYSISEGLADIFRNKMVSLLSIVTISVSITVLGLFMLIAVNLEGVSVGKDDTFLVHVFLVDQPENEGMSQIQEHFETDERVLSYSYVSPAEAQQRFEDLFPEEAELSRQLEDFSLPASFDVEINPDVVQDDEQLIRFADSLAGYQVVDEVLYDSKWQQSLQTLTTWVTIFGIFLGSLLIIAAIVTTSNIIKLNYLGRKEEIEIMRLVGADNIYIKGPFLVSGILQGFLASLLSVLLLYIVFVSGTAFLETAQISLIENIEFVFLPWLHLAALLLGGTLAGLLASLLTLVSVNRI
jgi:cell division transport system permease protein